jgi:hypothetical protein
MVKKSDNGFADKNTLAKKECQLYQSTIKKIWHILIWMKETFEKKLP